MVSDGLFGNCQKSDRLLPDVYQYQLTGAQRQQLESILLRLIELGYGWSHEYTQCVIGNVLLAYRSGVDFDLGFCTASRFPPASSGRYGEEELVVPSWLSDGRSLDEFSPDVRSSAERQSTSSLGEEDYVGVPGSEQVKGVEEFLEGLSSDDLDQLKKYVTKEDLLESVAESPAEQEGTGVVRRLSADDQNINSDIGELIFSDAYDFFNWTRCYSFLHSFQSCPWVQFLQPNPTQPTKRLTQPNPTHRKVKTSDPQTNPT